MAVSSISPNAWPSGGGDSVWTNLLPSIQQGLQMGFSIPQNMQDLQQKKLANALAQVNLQTAPQMNQADLALKQAQGNLTGEQAQYYPQLTQADIDSKNIETKYAPLKYAIDASNAARQNSRFNDAYNLSKYLSTLSPAERATFNAQHPDQVNQMLNDLGNRALQGQANAGQDVLNSIIKQYFPNTQQPLPQSPQQQNALQNASSGQNMTVNPAQLAAGAAQNPALANQVGIQNPAVNQGIAQGVGAPQGTLPLGASGVAPFTSTPEQIAQMKNIATMAANKDLVTTKTRNQLEGAVQVQDYMNDPGFQSRALNASQYAGALGQGKASIDALMQQNPKAYEDYLAFKNQDAVLLQNRIKTLDGMGATDSQREELNGLFNKTLDAMTSNPSQFLTQLNLLGKSLDTVAHSVQHSASPAGEVNRLGNYQPIGTTTQSNSVRLQAPDGKTYVGPADKMADFLKAHPDLRRIS